MSEVNHIDYLFRKKLKDYSKEPPVAVWDSLAGKLVQKKKPNLFPVIWKVAAAITVMIMFGLGGDLVVNRNMRTEQAVADHSGEDRLIEEKAVTEVLPGENQEYESQGNTSRGKVDDVVFMSDNKELQGSSKRNRVHEVDLVSVKKMFAEKPESDAGLSDPKAVLAGSAMISQLAYQISPPSAQAGIMKVREYQAKLYGPGLPADKLFIEDRTKSDYGTWYLAGMAAPEYSYRAVKNGDMADAGFFDNSEQALFTWSGGFHLGYQATKRLSFQSGLLFSRSGIQVDQLSTYGRPDLSGYYYNNDELKGNNYINVANSIGTISSDNAKVIYLSYNSTEENPDRREITSSINSPMDLPNAIVDLDAELIQLLNFIEVPLNLKYKLNEGKLQVSLLGGLSSNVLIGNKVVFMNEGGEKETGKTENIRAINYSGNLGLSFDYGISDHLKLVLEPRYKYSLHSINEDKLMNARPYLLGVFTGLRYSF